VDCEENALHVIARAAEGGMRDALSLLDQAISFGSEKVTIEDALTVTGAVSQIFLLKLAKAIKENDVVTGLESLEELLFQGKDPTRFIEDLILFYRDMLLYKAAPNLEESLERVMLDDDFQALASDINSDEIYQLIQLLSKTQQEMRWTNHPKIFLEVALVKLCQTEASAVKNEGPEWNSLMQRITELESEIHELKQNGVVIKEEVQPTVQKKKARPNRTGFQVPVTKVTEILKQATKQDLLAIKGQWAEMIDRLTANNMRSQAALLKEAEPVAASNQAFVIKFKYEIHCQMAMENVKFIEAISNILQNLIGKKLQVTGVPEDQWGKIREDYLHSQRNSNDDMDGFSDQEQEPIITEAIKLFGDDLIEIKD
jgi:DNA polymerase-3 subunit gamma/tau